METKTKTKLGKGESLRASSDARCPFDSGEGTLCYCDSPHMGVDVVPGKGGDTTSARNTDSDNSLRSGGSNEPSLSRTGLPSRDRKGRFLSRQKGPSKGQDKGGNRFAVLAADDKTDTDTDMVSGSPDRHIALTGRRKRPSSSTFASGRDGSDTEAEGAGLAKINTARRGKARGTTAGPSREKFLKPAPVRPEPVNILIDNEPDVGSLIVDDVVALNAQELRARAGEGLAVILEVARKSGNLKGEFVAKLKRSATDLSEVVDAFASRTEADEVRRLRAENRRFRIEIEAMKTELKAMRRGFAEAKTEAAANAAAAAAAAANASVAGSPATLPVAAMLEEFKHSLTCSLGDMMNVRLAQIEERLPPAPSVRPQLGAGGPRRPETAATTSAAPSTVAREETWATVVKRGKGKRKGKGKSSAPPSTPAVEGRTAAPAVKPTGKPAAASSARPAAKPTAKPTNQPGRPATKATVKAKFKAPKTAAVVVQLQPAAVEKGQTYDSIFRSAEDTVKLEELGIERILFRHTATGARMLEIPGSDKEEKADRLASRLREALSDVATVVRPVKTAQVRISGLDRPRRCASRAWMTRPLPRGWRRRSRRRHRPTSARSVGAIRSGFGGMGSTVVTCPVSVAKALTEGGRLLIGWSSVRVSALEALPMRCFKCMGLGHTRPKCPASVDRGDLCFKCGNAGHKVASCPEKTPRCVVCAEGGKPSGHIMCGRRCRPATSKGKGALGTRAPRETASQTAADGVAPPAAAGEVEVVMSE
ncbi:uncharacterized protein LOC123668161 [Melitaea cinxia]|uniref:uncharacterized protein LOC123668161 n=1 Tax=Melitaea cinxia TaxID=113334 RepID=UPI001E270E04|nr:uncharacterized protein LOC123668161 [Melitaea cinxia]